MSSDDSLTWILKQITGVAKTIGQARQELDGAMKGIMEQANFTPGVATTSPLQPSRAPQGAVVNPGQKGTVQLKPAPAFDPLIVAARNEGIDTTGKTREQVATELAIKLNSSRK